MKKLLVLALITSCLAFSCWAPAATVEEVSRRFLGFAYGGGALIVDKELIAPSYDCMTYVETVMALHLETKDQPASALLNRIRYFDGKRDEALRKHFLETDWISDNQKQGLVTDITRRIMPGAPSVAATIDKSAWFAKVHPGLAEAFEKSALPKRIDARLDYIPLESVPEVINGIPDGAIIIFIQDNVDKLVNLIKTPLIVGHMGLAVRVNGDLKLRQADSGAKVINDMDFAKAMVASRKYFRGITILEMQKR